MTSHQNVERRPDFEHVCVMQGVVIDVPIAQFEEELGAALGVRVQYLETVTTLPDLDATGAPVPDTGGRSDVFFSYCRADYSSEFNVRRLARGIRWLEDVLSARNNPNGIIYPERVRAYVPPLVQRLADGHPPPPAPAQFPDHSYLGSLTLAAGLVIRDTEPEPLRIPLNCAPGEWHAWVRRKKGLPVALLLAHEANLDRARSPIEAFAGQHAAAVASIVRARSPRVMELMPDVKAMIAAIPSDTQDLARLAHRNEPEFVERWNRGPITVLVHDVSVSGAEAPKDGEAVGALAGGGFWSRTTGPDGWCVVGLENDQNLAVVVRINLSGDHDHSYLINAASAELAERSERIPKEASGTARPYSPKERFAVGDILEHPSFGLGRVVEVLAGNKLRANFDDAGAKVLIHGR